MSDIHSKTTIFRASEDSGKHGFFMQKLYFYVCVLVCGHVYLNKTWRWSLVVYFQDLWISKLFKTTQTCHKI